LVTSAIQGLESEEPSRKPSVFEYKQRKEISVNQSVVQELLKKVSGNHQFKRKLKIFLGVGLVGFLLVGGLILWAGVSAVQRVVSIGANSNVQEQVWNLKTEIPNIPSLAKVGCWDKVKGLMSVQVWLEKPVVDNIKYIKDACSETKPAK
jgi:hypothetical protein